MTTVTNDTPEPEALRVAMDRGALGLRTATPGVVVAVDPSGRWVDVQPAVSLTSNVDGPKPLTLPVVSRVPLLVLGSTTLGLFVAVPVRPGDDGLLIVSDRALDNWQDGEGVQATPAASSPRHHDLTDAFFLPGAQRMSGAIPDYPTDAIEVRTRDGATALSVSPTSVTSTVGTTVMAVTAAGVDITGSIRVNGVDIGPNHYHHHDHGGDTTGIVVT
jgi:Phage protein Gp138 N-terminal domain